MKTIRILIADDHRLFRAGIAEVLREHHEFEVVGEASTGEDAIEKVKNLSPDIVLMDIDFGDLRETQGITATQKITEQYGDGVHVIMLTMHDEKELLIEAFDAGARGYLLKDADPRQMIDTIEAVHHGGVILTPEQASNVMERFQRSRQTEIDQLIESLTAREREILQLVAEGANNAQIADELDLSEKTIRNRLSGVFSKLHVNNRVQAARLASELGLFTSKSIEQDGED